MSSPLLVVTIENIFKNALIQESAQNLGTTAEGFVGITQAIIWGFYRKGEFNG